MRIAIVEPNAHQPGHFSNEIRDVAQAMVRAGEIIMVYSPFGFKEQWASEENCVQRILLDQPFTKRLLTLYGYQLAFYKSACIAAEQDRIDLMYVWSYNSVYPLWYNMHKNKSFPIVLILKRVLRPIEPIFGSAFLGRLRTKISLIFLAFLADHYVVHTTVLRDQAQEIGIPLKKISLIPTGMTHTNSFPEKVDARLQLAIPNEYTVLLSLGVHREEKGSLQLVRAAQYLQSTTILVLCGIDRTNRLKGVCENPDIKPHVMTHLEYIPAEYVPLWYSACDVVVLSHLSDFVGDSAQMLDAINYRRPIISSGNLNVRSVIEEYGIGVEFNLEDPYSLAPAVDAVQNIPVDLLTDSFKQLQSVYDWSRLAAQHLALCRKVVEDYSTV